MLEATVRSVRPMDGPSTALPSPAYQHAFDSGVYLPGVDSSHLRGRSPVEHGPFGQRPGSLALVVFGQSNAANHGEGRHTAGPRVYNFNLFDALIYPAADPLLGATGDDGSPWCLVADSLLASGYAEEVLLVPLAVGGAAVVDWAPGGPYHHRLSYALDRLARLGNSPTHFLWHQGEADALYGTSAADYRSRLRALVLSIRQRGNIAPFYVATASYFANPQGFAQQQQTIRAAQAGLPDTTLEILPGPNTDLILDRHDGCHMASSGLREHAAAWVEVLMSRARLR
jgi:hypothetical protein